MNIDQAREFYGRDADEWLRRWDAGEIVWSIEMGGIGPGYEQCIQITAAEILRHMIEKKYKRDLWVIDNRRWRKDCDAIETFGHSNKTIKALGLSGAQWGAALSLAAQLYRRGPADLLMDERAQDRKIQTRREMPQAA